MNFINSWKRKYEEYNLVRRLDDTCDRLMEENKEYVCALDNHCIGQGGLEKEVLMESMALQLYRSVLAFGAGLSAFWMLRRRRIGKATMSLQNIFSAGNLVDSATATGIAMGTNTLLWAYPSYGLLGYNKAHKKLTKKCDDLTRAPGRSHLADFVCATDVATFTNVRQDPSLDQELLETRHSVH